MNKFFHIFLLLISIIILANTSAIVNASSLALMIWFEKLLPSMFVGMVFIRLLTAINILPWLMQPLHRLTEFLFGLDAGAFALTLVSLLLGFPASAMMIDEAIGRKELPLAQGQRLILCCCCASSSFIIGTVGAVLYQSVLIGVKLWLIQGLSVLTLLLFTRSRRCQFIAAEGSPHLFISFADALGRSINTMLVIAGYLMITLSLCALITPYLPSRIAELLSIIAEFSSGCVLLAQSSVPLFQKLLFTSMLLSFGGICVHFQILGSCGHAELSLYRFLAMRLIQSLLAVLFTFFIL